MVEQTPDFKAGYTAGERDGRATGFWEGYGEALADAQKAGLMAADPEVTVTVEVNLPDGD